MNIRNKKYIAPTAQVFDDICSGILANSPVKINKGEGDGGHQADAKSGEFSFDEDEE